MTENAPAMKATTKICWNVGIFLLNKLDQFRFGNWVLKLKKKMELLCIFLILKAINFERKMERLHWLKSYVQSFYDLFVLF